ncbi:MAG: response regulator [Rhodospirillaceae bacterium]|jgi:CheY-like chemotaxis protein|nr:response regulator [Rhodospirillaceae bacterium]MBT5523696.1 response regulator [Rhodospirillaceae bacterium]MBT6589699.1 response regulator [Rhodospirillaceae bacterium]MBT6985127.1 response regulator [Rhodospirillaceae bacterium]
MAKILVVDDEAAIRRLLSTILRREGYEILEAANGRLAMDLIHANDLDLVITDIMMPEQDGIETVLRIKEFNANIKVIVISGGGHQRAMDFLPAAERLGADLTLKKPFKPLDVLEAVGNLLQTANVSA